MRTLTCVALALTLAAATSPAAWAWDETRRMSAPQPACSPGVTCSVSVTPGFMAGQVTLDFRGRAPALAASRTAVRVYDRSGALVTDTTVGFMSNGDVTVLLGNGQTLAPGPYRYVIEGVAKGTFEVLTGAAAPKAASRPAATPAPASRAPNAPAAASASASLAGTWYGIAGTPGTIELGRDGSYKLNGKPGGRYRRVADEVVFDGALVSWNKGRAKLKDGVLEFEWRNAEGFNNWFVFQKG